MFSRKKLLEILLILNVDSTNMVNTPLYQPAFLSFWKKLESWLDRLNTPLPPHA